MAVSSYAASDLDSSIETDAVPIPPAPTRCQKEADRSTFEAEHPTWSPPVKEIAAGLPDTNDSEDDDKRSASDALLKFSCTDEPSNEPTSGTTTSHSHLNAGDFKVENSAVEIDNSSVHFGHNVRNQTDINVATAKSVIIDRRQYNYITNYPHAGASQVTSPAPLPIIEIVRDFNRNRYLDRLALITPLPWCTRFSPHLDNIYTTVQLVSSDRFNGSLNRINIPLEQILEEKGGDGDEQSASASRLCRPCRVLIEGNPGYGKTTLTLRMALDWAAKKSYMNKFQLVFLIQLRYFKGDLQSYIFDEFFPRHEDKGRDDWWRHVKENQEQILFILDGLDELAREHRDSIDVLLKGNLLDRTSLVVTSRLVPSDDSVLSCFNRRILIRGFSEGQTEQFIHNYFQLINEPQQGSKLKTLLNGPRWCGRHLTSCPLTCLLLCTVFKDEGDRILSKITEVYRDLAAWLIRRAATSHDSTSEAAGVEHYERALHDFGYLCIQALANAQMTFTSEQLLQLPGNSGQLLLKMGLLVQSHTLGNTMRNPKNLCYQLIHKTFLEYLGAYHLSFQVDEKLMSNFDALQSERFTRESLHLTFKFLAGLLGENAATFFRFHYLSHFDLPMLTLYELLHESGATPENVRAVSSILDYDFVLVQSKRVELEAWARLLVEPDCPIRCLKFQWASGQKLGPDDAEAETLDFGALDLFFTAFQSNTSVVCLTVSAAMDLSPNDKEASAMAAFTAQALKKCQLRHFSLNLIGDTWSSTVISAVSRVLNYRHAASSLVTVNINVDLDSNQISSLCQGLRQLSNIKLLVLTKLSCGPEGFEHIASLLKTIQHLAVSLSLIKELPPASRNSVDEGSPQHLGTFSSFFIQSAQQRAGINSYGHPVCEEAASPAASDDLSSSRRTSTSSVLSILDINQSNRFTLEDGLRFPGILAPRAIGLSGLTVPGCPAQGSHCSGFHFLFTALKDPDCRLVRLDLTGCHLGIDDFHCLGEALRKCPSVKALRFARLEKFEEVFPILLNTRLAWLDLSSSLIAMNNVSTVQLINALSSAEQLVNLSLAGWKFTITSPQVIKEVQTYMKTSRLQEMSLANCRIQLIIPGSYSAENGKKMYPSLQSINGAIGDAKAERNPRFFRSWSLRSLTSLSSSSSSSPSSSSPSSSSVSSSPSQGVSFFPRKRSRLQGLRRFTLSSWSLSDSALSTSYQPKILKENESWPHLAKLSLAAAVVSCQVDDGRVQYYTGPELITYLDGLKNLSELSVSLKSKIRGEITFDSPEMNDHVTRRFFSLLQRKFGRTLTRLHMSCCSIAWHRPSQTAMYLIRHLQKCEKLVCVELNFSRFHVVTSDQVASDFNAQKNVNSSSDERQSHWLLEAIVCGIPHLEELNLTGMELTPFQASALAQQIRDRWKGLSLRIHTREVGDNFVFHLIQYLKSYPKFHVEHVGGNRDTILVQRRSHLCGLFRYLLTSSTSETGESTTDDDCQEHSDLYSSLLPDHRNLLGLTPFDFSIMHAHLWNMKTSFGS